MDRACQVFMEANGEYLVARWEDMYQHFMEDDQVSSDMPKEELVDNPHKLIPAVVVSWLTDPSAGNLSTREPFRGHAWAYNSEGSLAFHIQLKMEPRRPSAP